MESGLVSSALNSGSKSDPLSQEELEPFLGDLCEYFQVSDDDVWQLLTVQEGQPFRLNLWHCLSMICQDPDADYFHTLREGSLWGFSRLFLPVL